MSEEKRKADLVDTYPLLPVGIGFFGLALALVVAIFFCEEPYGTTKAVLDALGALVMGILGALCVRYKGLKGEE